MKNFSLFGELSKVEEKDDGTIIVKGVASTESIDSEGEIVTADAMRKAIPDYMRFGAVREMHGDSAAGTAISIGVNDDGVTEFEAHIVDPVAVKKCLTSVYKGFSVGVRKMMRDELNKRKITQIKLTEISLVDRPANPDATFSLAKFDKPTKEGHMAKKKEGEALAKGLYDVQTFAGLLCSLGYVASNAAYEAVMEGDASPVPAKIKAGLAGLAEAFKDMAAEEVQEMLAGIKISGVPDVLALAAETEDLRKKGAAFSAATKEKMAKAHDHIKAADSAMSETGYNSKDEGDMNDDAKKGEGLAKLEAEVKGFGEKLAKLEADGKEKDGKLAKLEAEAKEKDERLAKSATDLKEAQEGLDGLLAELKKLAPASNASGAALEKKDDTGEGAKPETENEKLAKSDNPKDAIKLSFRTKATDVSGRPLS